MILYSKKEGSCSAGAAALSLASNPLAQSALLTVYSYLINKSAFVILSPKYFKKEVSILLQEGMQLQCLQIHRKSTLWLS